MIILDRRVPCLKGQLCPDENLPQNVVSGNQFTFKIRDDYQPRFWYISLVACYRNNVTCQWEYYEKNDELEYDIWLINGDPDNTGLSSLSSYQFSYDRQNTMELYLLFFVCYVILVPLQLYAVRLQKHPVTKLFTASLLLEFLALCLILVHILKFAFDGVGYDSLEVAGDILDILSRVSLKKKITFLYRLFTFLYKYKFVFFL